MWLAGLASFFFFCKCLCSVRFELIFLSSVLNAVVGFFEHFAGWMVGDEVFDF